MKVYVYSIRDKKLGAFMSPMFKTEDPEHVSESYIRSLKLVGIKDYSRAADQALYFLGIFDDIEGKFDLKEYSEKLIDFEDYLPSKEDLKDD